MRPGTISVVSLFLFYGLIFLIFLHGRLVKLIFKLFDLVNFFDDGLIEIKVKVDFVIVG